MSLSIDRSILLAQLKETNPKINPLYDKMEVILSKHFNGIKKIEALKRFHQNINELELKSLHSKKITILDSPSKLLTVFLKTLKEIELKELKEIKTLEELEKLKKTLDAVEKQFNLLKTAPFEKIFISTQIFQQLKRNSELSDSSSKDLLLHYICKNSILIDVDSSLILSSYIKDDKCRNITLRQMIEKFMVSEITHNSEEMQLLIDKILKIKEKINEIEEQDWALRFISTILARQYKNLEKANQIAMQISNPQMKESSLRDILVLELRDTKKIFSNRLSKPLKTAIEEVFETCLSQLEEDAEIDKNTSLFLLRQKTSLLLEKLSKEELQKLEKEFNEKDHSDPLKTIFFLTEVNQKTIAICDPEKSEKEKIELIEEAFNYINENRSITTNRVEALILMSIKLVDLDIFKHIQTFAQFIPDCDERSLIFLALVRTWVDHSNNIEKVLELIDLIPEYKLKEEALNYAYQNALEDGYLRGIDQFNKTKENLTF